MADSLYGYTDSFDNTKKIGMYLPVLDYDKDFAVSHDGDAVILSNVTTPVDQPETLRFAQYDVANVYKNTDIQPIHRQNGLKGKKNMISVLDTARVVNADSSVTDYPVKVSMAMEFPVSANLTSDNIYQVVQRCIAATQDYMRLASVTESGWGNADASLLNVQLRGSLNPQDGIACEDRTPVTP